MPFCRSHWRAWLEQLSMPPDPAVLKKLAMRYLAVLMALLSLLVFSCAGQKNVVRPGKGVYHLVKKGETLSQIALAYGVSQRKLVEANNIRHPDHLEAGSVVFIPDAVRVLDVGKVLQAKATVDQPEKGPAKKSGEKKPPSVAGKKERKPAELPREGTPKPGVDHRKGGAGKPAKEKNRDAVPTAAPPPPPLPGTAASASPGKVSFAWPVRGRVASRFGRQPNGMVFNHIRIATRDHAQIVAAASGTVIFSAPLRDFGETVIIKHDDDFATVYTHLGSRSVRADSRIKKGEIVGQTGKSEKKGEGYMNFEIRRHNKALDPLLFLP